MLTFAAEIKIQNYITNSDTPKVISLQKFLLLDKSIKDLISIKFLMFTYYGNYGLPFIICFVLSCFANSRSLGGLKS